MPGQNTTWPGTWATSDTSQPSSTNSNSTGNCVWHQVENGRKGFITFLKIVFIKEKTVGVELKSFVECLLLQCQNDQVPSWLTISKMDHMSEPDRMITRYF